jgi:paraquat-inducible protein B
MKAGEETLVGAFVLGGIVLAVSAVVLFGKFSLFNPSVQAAIVFQDSVGGLSVGSPVSFRGVRVGAVESIAIDYDPAAKVATIPVIVRLKPDQSRLAGQPVDLAELVKRGLRAELNVQSFVTGQSQIELDFDPGSPAVLHEGVTTLPEIPTRPSTLQRAREQLSQLPLRELASDASATLVSLRGLTEKLDADLPPLVDSLKATSEKSGQMVDSANRTIEMVQGRLDTVLSVVGEVAGSVDQQVAERGADLHTVLTEASQTMVQARDVLIDAKSLTSPRAGSRANIESALRDLAAAAASLRGFANDVEHNPSLLLTGRKP